MVILNGGAGSKGRTAYSCTYFLCFYVPMFPRRSAGTWQYPELILQPPSSIATSDDFHQWSPEACIRFRPDGDSEVNICM